MQAAARFVHPSNLVSYASLAFALGSVHRAAGGDLHGMAALWALSALADNFDGAFARLFRRDEAEMAFGRQLDSLIDAVAFGVVPVVGLRLTAYPAGDGARALFWVAALAFCVANVTRLGHFNLASDPHEKVFSGLPTTEAALVLSTALLAPGGAPWASLLMGVLAVAMLTPLTVPAPRRAAFAGLLAWLLGVPIAHLWLAAGR